MFRASDLRFPAVLHLALALLILIEGVLNVAHGFAEERDSQLIVFGAAEVIGAILFVWSRTIAVGACILVCAFLIAAAVHVLGAELPIEHLVYAVAVLVVLAQNKRPFGAARSAA